MAREILFDLGKMITDRLPYKFGIKRLTENDPEYIILDRACTSDEIAEVMLKMGLRKPKTTAEIAKLTGKSEQRIEELLTDAANHGIVEYHWENPQHEKQWYVQLFVPGIAEMTNMVLWQVEKYPEIADAFDKMTFLPLEGKTHLIPPGGDGIGMHVIPVEKAIQAENKSLSIEHISHWLDKYDGKLSVGYCSCRNARRLYGEGSGEIQDDCCIGLGDFAEYLIETGKGRRITKEEALQICQRAEDNGYVHQTTNIDGQDKIFGLCNCDLGVCFALRTSQYFNTPNLSASAYRAHVEKEKCVACGKCVEVCPAGAVKLGQKLCTQKGEVEYPKQQLPTLKWGKDNYNPNYVADNRKNCHESGTAPCKTACPAHIAIQGYIKLAKEGRYLDALKLIKQDNPFPAVCGAICNRRCEDACTRGTVDDPIAIDEIKKFIADQELHADKRFIPICEKDDGGMWGPDYKMAVIGAGPAGMSAAYYLRTRGYDVTVFEKESRPGGMLMNGIPSFRLEKDVIEAEIDVLREMGVEFKCGVEVGRDITIQDLKREGYKAFYLAIGLQGGRKTGIPGEDAQGVESGVSFLSRINQDHTIRLHGDVVVVGGGNVAVDVARSAARATDGKVTMLCLESEKEMPAARDEVEEAIAEGINVMYGWGPKKVLTEDGKVKGIVFRKCISVFNKLHVFEPKFMEDSTITIECSNVLEAIGQSAQWGSLLEGTKVERHLNGTVKHDPVTFETGEPGIFVGGDIAHGARFAIDAIADGKLASESMHRYVHPGQSQTIARDLREFIELDKDNIVLESFDNAKRQVPGRKPGNPVGTFDDLRLPFTEEQIRKEASRCLGCGATVVDLNRCIGCGLCTTRCEFDAIHLSRDIPEASNMVRCEDKLPVVAKYAAAREMKIIKKKALGGKAKKKR